MLATIPRVDSSDPANPVAPYLLQLLWDVPADRLEDFRSWYSEEHLPDMAGVPGILLARRFERETAYPFASPATSDHLTIYEVADRTAFDTDEYRNLSTAPSERTMKVATGLGMRRMVYHQLYPAVGVFGAGAVSEAPRQPTGTAVLHITMGSDPDYEDDFNRWYNEDHLPAVTSADGVLYGRRFIELEGDAATMQPSRPLRYLALYELAEVSVASSPGFVEASKPTDWRRRLGDHLQSHVQVYREVARREGTPSP
jgi:hypothetical protein